MADSASLRAQILLLRKAEPFSSAITVVSVSRAALCVTLIVSRCGKESSCIGPGGTKSAPRISWIPAMRRVDNAIIRYPRIQRVVTSAIVFKAAGTWPILYANEERYNAHRLTLGIFCLPSEVSLQVG